MKKFTSTQPGSHLDPKFCPANSSIVSFVRNRELWILDLTSGEEHQLTDVTDGGVSVSLCGRVCTCLSECLSVSLSVCLSVSRSVCVSVIFLPHPLVFILQANMTPDQAGNLPSSSKRNLIDTRATCGALARFCTRRFVGCVHLSSCCCIIILVMSSSSYRCHHIGISSSYLCRHHIGVVITFVC